MAAGDRESAELIVHVTELQRFLGCQRAWWFDRRSTLGRPTSRPLIIGSWVHILLAVDHLEKGRADGTLIPGGDVRYLDGPEGGEAETQVIPTDKASAREALSEFWEGWSDKAREDFYTAADRRPLPLIVSAAVDEYRNRYKDDRFEVLAVEAPVEFALDGGTIEGRVDLVKRDRDGDVVIVDHKTTGGYADVFMPGGPVADLVPPQLQMYAEAFKAEYGLDVFYLEWDIVSIKEPTFPNVRQDGRLGARSWESPELAYHVFRANSSDDIRVQLDHLELAYKLGSRHFLRRLFPVDPGAGWGLMRQAEQIVDDIRAIDEGLRVPTRTLGRDCNRCDWVEPCLKALRRGATA